MVTCAAAKGAENRKKKLKMIAISVLAVTFLFLAVFCILKQRAYEKRRMFLEGLNIPAYSGMPYAPVNDNKPFFSDADLGTDSFESYSELDALGRCGAAYANIGRGILSLLQAMIRFHSEMKIQMSKYMSWTCRIFWMIKENGLIMPV